MRANYWGMGSVCGGPGGTMLGMGRRNAYRSAMGRVRRTMIAAAIFSVGVNVLMLTGPLFMLQVYDRVLASGSIATLQGLLIAAVGAYLFLGLYDFLRTRLMSRAAYRLDADVAPHAFSRWVASGVNGEGASRPLNDLATVRSFLSSPPMLGMFDLPFVPLYLAVVVVIHPWLGFLAVAGAAIVVVLALLNQWTTQAHLTRAMSMDASETFFVEQARRTGETLLPLGMLRHVSGHWRAMHGEGLRTGQIGADRGEGFAASSKAFRLLLQSALLALGGYLAVQQQISAGMIVAASIIAGRALAPIDMVIGQWRAVVRARAAHSRLTEEMEGTGAREQRLALPEPTGAIDVAGLVKLAPGARGRTDIPPLLDGITFDLRSGDGLGVIGPSASGKTSLARLLVGAWRPDGGHVRLDGATLDQWDRDELGRHIGYLPQQLELLTGTIAQNIARFDPEATDEAVLVAAQLAGVHDMIVRLPSGYETRVDPSSTPLSGGQVQRIGLARALYGDPKLVVLDEPNSNLDNEGDAALTRAILSIRERGASVVVMAHRPSAIASVNKIMVINDGRVSDLGDKDEVLRRATRAAPSVRPASTAGSVRSAPSPAETGNAVARTA